MAASAKDIIDSVNNKYIKKGVAVFRTGDTIKVHARIIEGNKERIQIFEGVVIKRSGGDSPSATFTVRKVSFNTGVERTFMLHSPRVEKIEVVAKGIVRRARLFYLRNLRGKAARIRREFSAGGVINQDIATAEPIDAIEEEAPASTDNKKSKKKTAAKADAPVATDVEAAPAAE